MILKRVMVMVHHQQRLFMGLMVADGGMLMLMFLNAYIKKYIKKVINCFIYINFFKLHYAVTREVDNLYWWNPLRPKGNADADEWILNR